MIDELFMVFDGETEFGIRIKKSYCSCSFLDARCGFQFRQRQQNRHDHCPYRIRYNSGR